ncbi:MAG: deoxyribonuclease IV [Oscillospiraceae bacterium]|jgi:deoxyribonuclease-4|nr:deoxyribonuclease IV [Oscillospiraceae bacterium]
MFRIGCHLSSSGGYLAMGRTAEKLGANVFQFFTRNPRGGAARAIDENDIASFLSFASERGIDRLLAHAPYTLNACAEKAHLREFARETMADDIRRMEYLPGNMYNFHPGSHVGQGAELGVSLIADTLNSVLSPDQTTVVLLETMAGKGSELGGKFEELRAIIDAVELDGKLGVCLDTCHVYDAGYDIRGDLDGVLEEFDAVVGPERLRAIHLNDSKNPFGSHKDRHEKIGAGSLGLETFERIINHPRLRDLPFYLETPNEPDGYAEEIALLRSLRSSALLNN